jgi:hypothetical protein
MRFQAESVKQGVLRKHAEKMCDFGHGRAANRKILIIGNALRDGKIPGPVRQLIAVIRQHRLAVVVMGDEFRTSMLDLLGHLHHSPKEKRLHVLNKKEYVCSLPEDHQTTDDGCKCICSMLGCNERRHSDFDVNGHHGEDPRCRKFCEDHSRTQRVEIYELSVDSNHRVWQRDYCAAISISLRFIAHILGVSLAGSLYERKSTWVRSPAKRKNVFHRDKCRHVRLSKRKSLHELFVEAGLVGGVRLPAVTQENEVSHYKVAAGRRHHFRFPDQQQPPQ